MIGEVVAYRVLRVVRENAIASSLYLKPLSAAGEPKPGQFYMVWVPGFEEIPISASGYSGGVLRITVAEVGRTSGRLRRSKPGEILGLKGPLGRSLPLKRARYLLISGGYGSAPLVFALAELLKIGADVVFATGARRADYLLFVEEAEELGAEVIVATDDGSRGFRGTVVEAVLDSGAIDEADVIVACGPEGLLVESARLAVERGKEGYVLAESYMKCGIGLCGSCVLGKSGLLVCRDGPVFEARTYLEALGLL